MQPGTNFSYSMRYLLKVGGLSSLISADYSQRIDEVIDLLFDVWREERWVYIMGNGGSASTATHLSADLAKTICEKPGDKGIKTMPLFDNVPMISALINDWGWDDVYLRQLDTYYEKGGVGIGISVHGGSGGDKAGKWSQNLLKGLQYIKDRGGKTIGLVGFDGGAMKDLVDIAIVIPVNSTPLVESFHVVLQHLIVFGLKEKIHAYKNASGFSRS